MHETLTARDKGERPGLRDSDVFLLKERIIALSARLTDRQLEGLTLALAREMRSRHATVATRRLDMRL
jgi:hypothetical protein